MKKPDIYLVSYPRSGRSYERFFGDASTNIIGSNRLYIRLQGENK